MVGVVIDNIKAVNNHKGENMNNPKPLPMQKPPIISEISKERKPIIPSPKEITEVRKSITIERTKTPPPPQKENKEPKVLGGIVGHFGLQPGRNTLTPYDLGWNAACDIILSNKYVDIIKDLKNPFPGTTGMETIEWERGKIDCFLQSIISERWNRNHPY